MKKITLLLTTILTVNINTAFQGSQLIQRDYVHPSQKNQFLDAAAQDEYTHHDEYTHNEIDQQNLEEYDQHNCDTAHSPAPSAITAVFTEIFGFMLMRYIIIRDTAHIYCHEIKELINKWFSAITKA